MSELNIDVTLDVDPYENDGYPAYVVVSVNEARRTYEEERGTCHGVWDTELTGRLRFQCSECGGVSLEITPRFCPVCGRKVVDA